MSEERVNPAAHFPHPEFIAHPSGAQFKIQSENRLNHNIKDAPNGMFISLSCGVIMTNLVLICYMNSLKPLRPIA